MFDSIFTNILRLRNLKEDIVSEMGNAGIVVPTGVKYDELSSLLDSFSPLTEADLISIIDRSIVNLELPDSLTLIGNYAFYACTSLTDVTFQGTPTSISASAFQYCINLTAINVPWSSGAVAGAPWGATNATITYNYVQ